jgi:REP element-mobilizing transposase RayT
VLNRANARMPIFDDHEDYEAFERVLAEAVERTETRLRAYCVMPNHWHLVVWPREDGGPFPGVGNGHRARRTCAPAKEKRGQNYFLDRRSGRTLGCGDAAAIASD